MDPPIDVNITTPSPPKVGEHEVPTILLIVCLMNIFSFMGNRLLQKYQIKWMSESAMTIIIGLAVGSFLYFAVGGVYKNSVHFDKETFTNFILPPIIFEAGFSLHHQGVVDNITVILTLAVPGTIITTLMLGFSAKLIAKNSYPELYDRPMWECMCLGAMLSAIDPIAVLSVLGKLFKEKTVKPRIYNVIFGESVLNDAVAVVLYKVFLDFLENDKDPTVGTITLAILVFCKIALASVLIGWATAALSALLLKYIKFRNSPPTEITILLLFGFGSYYIAEACSMSGIMALFICGRTSCHYTWHNMSTKSQVATPEILHVMAIIAETYVYSFLGLAFWSFKHHWQWGFTLLMLLMLFVSRALTVFPLVSITNCFTKKEKRLDIRSQLFMSLTGLRGAIAFGLALSAENNESIHSGPVFVSVALFLIVSTVFIFGNFSEYLFFWIGVPSDTPETTSTTPSSPTRTITKRVLGLEKRFIAPLLRHRDYRTHHERRKEEIGQVLGDLERFDVHGPSPRDKPPAVAIANGDESLSDKQNSTELEASPTLDVAAIDMVINDNSNNSQLEESA